MRFRYPFQKLPLRYKLFAWYSIVFIIAVTTASAFVFSVVGKTMEKSAEDALKNTNGIVVNVLHTSAELTIQNHLRAIAEKNRDIAAGFYEKYAEGRMTEEEAKQKTRAAFLSQTIGTTGYVFAIDVSKAPGFVPLVVHPEMEGENVSTVDFIKEWEGLKNGFSEYEWANPREPKVRPKAAYIVSFEPWHWIIAASSYLREFSDLADVKEFRSSILTVKSGATGYTYVLDSSGNVIIHPYRTGNRWNHVDAHGRPFIREICLKKRGKLVYYWKDPANGSVHKRLVIFDYLPEYDWIVASTGLLDELYAPLEKARNIIGVILVLTVLLVLPISFRIGLAITRPLRELTDRLEAGAGGDLSVRMERPRQDEAGRLAACFNTFMEHLEIEARERRQAEEALRRSEEKYRRLIETANEAIFLADAATGLIMEANRKAEELIGLPRKSIIGLRQWQLHAPEDALRYEKLFRESIGGDKTIIRDIFVHRSDGTLVPVEISANKTVLGGRLLLQSIFRDITAPKRAEDALRESEEKFRALVENTEDVIARFDRSCRYLYVNPAVSRFVDLRPEDFVGKGHVELGFPEKDSLFWDSRIRQVFETGKPQELEFELNSHEGAFCFSWRIFPEFDEEGEVKTVVTISQDITERRRVKEALQEQLLFLQTLIDTIPNPVFYKDAEGVLRGCNAAFEAFRGLTREEIVGRTVNDLYPEHLAAEIRKRDEEIFQNPGTQVFEAPAMHADGTEHDVIYYRGTFNNADGTMGGLLGVLVDITERKQAEKKLARLATAVEQTAEAVVITDTRGVIQYVNPAFERITGYTKKETLGANPRILKSGRHDHPFYRRMWETLSRGEVWTGGIANRKKDGSVYEEEMTISPVRDDTGRITSYVAVKRDVTPEAELERHLRQAQKMEALGTLAGGIAHDFNNILAAMMGYTEISLQETEEGSRLRRNLQQVLKAVQRATDLVRQILAFSRQSEAERRPIQIDPIIREALKLLRASIASSIEIRENIRRNAGYVLADPTQIHQVLMNLCTNAAQAMREKGGVLDVSLGVVNGEGNLMLHHAGLDGGRYVDLTVADTGHGMEPETLERIFDPYFTTKEKGVGTGLGLAVVHGIVKRFAGGVHVESELGKGSSFHVFFPVVTESASANRKPSLSPAGGRERVLFIDDEESIVEVGRQILVRLGYTVFGAVSATDAIKAFKEHPDEFDLVITDMTMPLMSGIELAREILSVRPDIPVILCTGFSEIITEEEAKAMGIREFIMKPYEMNDFAAVIRRALDQ